MNIRELLNTRFTEMYQLVESGQPLNASEVLDQLVQEIEDMYGN